MSDTYASWQSVEMPSPDDSPIKHINTVHKGGLRVNADGTTEQLGTSTYSTNEPPVASDHPLHNGRNSMGEVVPYNLLTEDSLVTINGITSNLNVFRQLGLASINSEGFWHVITEEEAGRMDELRQAREKEQEVEVELLDPYYERELGDAIEPLPQQVYDSEISRFSETLDISKVDISAIAHTSNLTTEEVKKRVETVEKAFTSQITKELGGQETAEKVLKWVKQVDEPSLKKAMRQLLVERRLDGFREISNEFKKDTKTPGRINQAVDYLSRQGYDVQKGANGGYTVAIEGRDRAPIEQLFREGVLYWK